jgi:hypothetical protein
MPTRRLGWAVALLTAVAAISGCIQPASTVDLTRTALAPFAVAPTNAPVVVPAGATPSPTLLVEQFILSRGEQPNGLQVWYDQPQAFDRLQGFSYMGMTGVPCVGYLLSTMANGVWQPNNGALVCADSPAAEAFAAVTYFLTSTGEPTTIVFGRVMNPAATAVAVVFNDGTSQQTAPQAGGFLVVRPDVVAATVITAINAEGNTIIPNIPQLPV